MTTGERLNKIELMLAEMQIKIDNLSANLDNATLQLNNALKRIEVLEEKDDLKRRNISALMFKGRLN